MANMSGAHYEFLAQTLGEVVEKFFEDEVVLEHIAFGDITAKGHHIKCVHVRLVSHLKTVFSRRLKTTSDRFDIEAFNRRMTEECWPSKK